MRRTFAALGLATALSAALSAAPSGAQAEEPVDLLFNTPHLAKVEAGQVLRYEHVRSSEPRFGIGADFDQTIEVTMGEARAASFTLDAEGAPRSFDVNDGVPGHPLLLVFLENALRSVATATGGSPFYLRNRMREALSGGLTAEADGAITMRPFADDANRDKLGAFGDMVLRFELSEAAPGMVVAMRAAAGPADAPIYAEEIRYETIR